MLGERKQADQKPSHAGAEQEIRQAWVRVFEQVTVTQHPLPLKRCDLPESAQAQSRADLGNGQEGLAFPPQGSTATALTDAHVLLCRPLVSGKNQTSLKELMPVENR